jgi:hypothetical protein
MVIIDAFMTVIIVMGGCSLLLFHPAIILVQFHQGSFFRRKEMEEVLALREQS